MDDKEARAGKTKTLTVAQAVDLAVLRFRQGHRDETESLCLQILAANPAFFEAYNRLGFILKELGRYPEAEAALRHAIALDPKSVEAHNNLGNVLKAQKKLRLAIASYKNALALDPNFADAHYNLGNALFRQGRLDAAVQSFDAAIKLKPDYAMARNNRGAALERLGRLDEAVTEYRHVCSLVPPNPLFLNNLGVALNAKGNSEEAVTYFRKAIKAKPDYADAHRYLANIKTFTQRDDDVKAIEHAYDQSGTDDIQKMKLSFALGKVFEDLKQPEKAFRFYLQGNALKRKTFRFSLATQVRAIEKIKSGFGRDFFDKPNPGRCLDETPVFIVGMPRSGTSLVEQILASHPDVFGAGELSDLRHVTGIYFGGVDGAQFVDKFVNASPTLIGKAGKDYIARLRQHDRAARFVTDKLPANFLLIGVIKRLFPRAKVIHCTRDPYDTCLSIYKQLFAVDGLHYAYDLKELGGYYRLYRELMVQWHETLPGFIFDICYEELVADPEGRTKALLTHCGLDWDDACLSFFKTDRPVRTASAAQVRQPIHGRSVKSWKRYEKWLGPLFDGLLDDD